MQKEAAWEQERASWEVIYSELTEEVTATKQSAEEHALKLWEERDQANEFYLDQERAKEAVDDFLRKDKTTLDGVDLNTYLEEFRHTIGESTRGSLNL